MAITIIITITIPIPITITITTTTITAITITTLITITISIRSHPSLAPAVIALFLDKYRLAVSRYLLTDSMHRQSLVFHRIYRQFNGC